MSGIMKTVTPAIVLAAAFAVLYGCSAVQAELLFGDYQNPGDGQLTIDTESGLEWLDWNQTQGISYNSIITQFGPGDTYDGWRHATSDEARGLLEGFGIPLRNWPEITRIDDKGAHVREIISFVGRQPSLVHVASARIQAEGGNQLMVRATDNDFSGSFIGRETGPDPDFEGREGPFAGTFTPVHGHALVRVTSVPEPTAYLLCFLGLGTFGLTRRRRYGAVPM